MRWETRVAARYLWMALRRSHSAALTLISTLGLAVGVATLLISLALLSGLQDQIRSRLIQSSPQLLIEPATSHEITNAETIVEEVERLGSGEIELVVRGIGWGTPSEGGRGQPVRLRSFVPSRPPAPEVSLGNRWSIKDEGPSIYVTRSWAGAVGAGIGDEVAIVAPRTELTPFGPAPVWKKFRITRIVAGSDDGETTDAWLPYSNISRLLGTNNLPTSIVVFGAATEATDRSRETLAAMFPNVIVKTWKEINRPLFLALRLEKVVMFVTISLVIFVAALNLVSSLSMTIVEKKPQIGVFRTLGASEKDILRLFMMTGLLIGAVGTVLGNVAGLGLSWAADHYGFVPLPGDLIAIGHVPFTIELRDVVIVNVIAVALSTIAAWYPARTASRLDPIVAIRDE